MNKEKIKEFVSENKDCIKAGIVGGVIAGVAYIIGYKACDRQYSIGLASMCVADPELEGRMMDAAKIVKDRIG